MFKLNLTQKTAVVTAILTTSALVSAAEADYSQITSGLGFGSAIAAVIAVGVAIAGVHGAGAGVRAVMRVIKGS